MGALEGSAVVAAGLLDDFGRSAVTLEGWMGSCREAGQGYPQQTNTAAHKHTALALYYVAIGNTVCTCRNIRTYCM